LGGVVLDGSFGKTTLPMSGPHSFLIPASVGKQYGGNLFQSFKQFNLNNSQTATFYDDSPKGPTIHNILARVTSGSPSSIDGTINSDIQGANLFFMNPAGVLFGQHAQLNVSGSVAVTTANYLKLADGVRFNANLGGGGMLTSAPVSAFGFLNSTPGAVKITGSNTPDSIGRLGLITHGGIRGLAPQKSFSVIAGDITMNASEIKGNESRVNLLSVKSAGEAKLDATSLDSAIDVTQFTAMGMIDITNSARIVTNLTTGLGGPVFIRAGTFLLNNSQINSTSYDGDDPHLNKFSNIDVQADDVTILAGGIIAAPTLGSSAAGTITVNADSLLIDGQGIYTTQTGLLALGLIDKTRTSSGDGGQITVTAGDVKIINAGSIGAYNQGEGAGGKITVTAADLLLIDGNHPADQLVGAGIFADGGDANGGDITIRAGDMKMIKGGEISTGSFGKGKGGTIRVTAMHSLVIDGTGSKDVFMPPAKPNPLSGNTRVFHGTGLLALGYGGGGGGSISLKAPALSIIGGGQVAAAIFGSGDGGKINLNTDSLLIDGTGSVGKVLFGTGIFAGAEAGSTGNGGRITVEGGKAAITDGGEISSANTGSGDAGRVSINTTGPVTVKNGSSISTASTSGDAGEIKLNSDGIIKLKDASTITASAGLNGGNIHITTPDLVYLLDSSITATAGGTGSTGSSGNGGNITIDHPLFIVANNSLISANATVGTNGNVLLDSDFLFTSNSTIFATGTINITAPSLDLGAQLITLPASLLSAENQLQERCTALLQADFSSFISIGRGGTEPAPDELQEEF
jgi:filamentous hemagglutinin family protein